MKIILLKDIPKIGKRYDVKDVKDGYALNSLIPNKLAIPATDNAVKSIGIEKAREEGERMVQNELIMKNLEGLKDTTLTVSVKTNEKGHLFAGLHAVDIVKEIEKQTRLSIDPELIKLDNPIKEIGEYSIGIKDMKFSLRVQSSS